MPVLDLHDTSRRVTTSLAVESFALYMIALVLVLAGGLLVAQVLSRFIWLLLAMTWPRCAPWG